MVYDLPNSTSATGIARALLNDWQINGIMVLRSGLPFTVKSGTDRSLTAVGQDNGDLIGDPTRPGSADPVQQWFNTAAFAPAALGTIGTAERNCAARPERGHRRHGALQELPHRLAGEVPVPPRGVQRVQPGQLQQPELDDHGGRELRENPGRRRPAGAPARVQAPLLVSRAGAGRLPPPLPSSTPPINGESWVRSTRATPIRLPPRGFARACSSGTSVPRSRSGSASCRKPPTSSS
ncbi:MAG: hypothetical protein M0C28_17980 [Candidatus Moduliflexus flocculans]|nr:hypothetical protein [Candidatus Moduliflexus flocculans]